MAVTTKYETIKPARTLVFVVLGWDHRQETAGAVWRPVGFWVFVLAGFYPFWCQGGDGLGVV